MKDNDKKKEETLSFPLRLLIGCIAWILKTLSWTHRDTVDDPYNCQELIVDTPYILVFWHNRNLSMVMKSPPNFRTHGKILVSRSKDGIILTELLKHFGVETVRGSSNKKGVDKGGARALVEFRRLLKNGVSVSLTPDGPRGPRYEIQGGVIWLASKCGVPIVPMGYNPARYATVNNWDGTVVALPFTKGVFKIGKPIEIPPELSEEGIEEYRQKVREGLMAITEDKA